MSRILFVMLHPGFVRYYDEALEALAAAGHDVHVAFEVNRTKLGEDVTAARLSVVSPRLTCGTTPERRESVREFLARSDRDATRSGGHRPSPWSRQGREDAWESLATTVRLALDYLRFFDPVFAHADALRERAAKRVPRLYRRLIGLVARGGAFARARLAGMLAGIERIIPPNHAIDAFLRGHAPDLVLVTPLVELGSQQVDYVKSARRLGIRSALCVASWDNLTSKGLIRVLPDHVVVWNEAQKREAVDLHGVPSERVVITGAQLFDRWFEARPSRSRADFCRTVGLDPDRPFVLYVGSSIFIAPEEVPFVERWVSELRASGDPALARVGVLVRPHPANSRQWRAFDAAEFDNVAVWPPVGTDPNAPDFRRDYFDSLHHSAGVVGVNTSAQLEAGIVGRPVFTIRAPEFAHAQEGTLHFRHLVDAGGGLVQAAATFDEHVRQLSAAVGAVSNGAKNREFVRSFIRPFGLDAPAVPRFVGAIEDLARLPSPRAARRRLWTLVLRPPAFLLARMAWSAAEDRPLWVHGLRPVMTIVLWSWAAVYRLQETAGRTAGRLVRWVRRDVRRLLYETSHEMRRYRHRIGKRLTTRLRTTGVALKRAARSSTRLR
ncbi:MAG: hypothetical protein A3H29_11630 [Acidobacteria bacterium RIFCSPLOWO2_02_FULL_67_21]|nr:MAG: hypothetical protein A3H29_11630 [Acidobacteria bacterium RIFCSPLOWO2_02_FULL_67_21]